MEREKVDKAALGYDYQSETEKHQSQKGEATLSMSSSDSWPDADRTCVCVQITPQASGVVTASRPTAWIRSALRLSDHVIHWSFHLLNFAFLRCV